MDERDGVERTGPDQLRALADRESQLLRMLAQCTPPVDQHRRELERVRSELADLRQRRSSV